MAIKEPDPMKGQHVLAFMYLTFAHFTDGDVTSDELSVIKTKVGEWGEMDGNDAVSEAMDWYNSCNGDQRANAMGYFSANIKEALGMTDDSLRTVLNDMVSIAKSDGKYDDEEKRWVEITAKNFGIEYEV